MEGFAQNQIKFGLWIDELGRVRTYQGGFVEGLNKSQIAMGQFMDELGNIYDKTGEFVGQADKAARAAAKLETSFHQEEESARGAVKQAEAFAVAVGKFKGLAGTLGYFFSDFLGGDNVLSSFPGKLGKTVDLAQNFREMLGAFATYSEAFADAANGLERIARAGERRQKNGGGSSILKKCNYGRRLRVGSSSRCGARLWRDVGFRESDVKEAINEINRLNSTGLNSV